MSNDSVKIGDRINVKTTLWRQGRAAGEGAPAFGEVVGLLTLHGTPHAVVAIVGGGTFTPWDNQGTFSCVYAVVPCTQWAIERVFLPAPTAPKVRELAQWQTPGGFMPEKYGGPKAAPRLPDWVAEAISAEAPNTSCTRAAGSELERLADMIKDTPNE